MKQQNQKTQKGITLIALIITIIVMMILVAVSVTVALQSGLFSAAGNAASKTKEERENELLASEGEVTVEGTPYDSMQEYVDSLNGESTGDMIEVYLLGAPLSVKNGSTWEEVIAGYADFFLDDRYHWVYRGVLYTSGKSWHGLDGYWRLLGLRGRKWRPSLCRIYGYCNPGDSLLLQGVRIMDI